MNSMDSVAMINNFEKLIMWNHNLVDLLGDCPNIEHPVVSEPIFWKTIAAKNGYECQRNLISGKCRVVSPCNTRVANGSRNAMLEKMERLADKEFFRRGDVIGVMRGGLYEHYGIYLGNGRVIHYCGEGNDFGGRVTIHEAPFSEFVKNSKRCFVVWFDDGRPIKLQQATSFLFSSVDDYYPNDYLKNKRTIYTAEETIARAKKRLGEEQYNLVSNNCEHFAMWCKTGVSESSQVNRFVSCVVHGTIPEMGITMLEAQKY